MYRFKIHGFIEGDGWPYARLHTDVGDLFAEMQPELWPEGLDAEPGMPFTLHYKGGKFLYLYPITKPVWTRSSIKRARIRAREWMKLFNEPEHAR